jgi:hypothetical protein
MKSTLQHARSIQTQLQAAADLIEGHASFRVDGSPATLLPLVLLSRSAKTQEATLIGKLTVRLFGTTFPILVKRCGLMLGDLPTGRLVASRKRR